MAGGLTMAVRVCAGAAGLDGSAEADKALFSSNPAKQANVLAIRNLERCMTFASVRIWTDLEKCWTTFLVERMFRKTLTRRELLRLGSITIVYLLFLECQ
jgi:hypothetical protein